MGENIEIVRKLIEAGAARPRRDYETLAELAHPDHVFVPVEVGGSAYEGAAGYETWLRDIGETLPWTMEFDGAIEAGPRTVIAQVTLQMQGDASEIEFEQQMWMVVRLAEGKAIRTESFVRADDALRAAAEPAA